MDYFPLDKNKLFLISAKALIRKNGKVLVIQNQTKKKGWAKKWGLPGGIVEYGESLSKGLAREIFEETHLKVKIGKIFTINDYFVKPFTLRDGRTFAVRFIGLTYLCSDPKGEVKLSEEHINYSWADASTLRKLPFAPDTKAVIEDYLKTYSR